MFTLDTLRTLVGGRIRGLSFRISVMSDVILIMESGSWQTRLTEMSRRTSFREVSAAAVEESTRIRELKQKWNGTRDERCHSTKKADIDSAGWSLTYVIKTRHR